MLKKKKKKGVISLVNMAFKQQELAYIWFVKAANLAKNFCPSIAHKHKN